MEGATRTARCCACWAYFLRILVAFRAMIVRSVFIIYAFVAVKQVVSLKKYAIYWLLLGTIFPLMIEMFYATYIIVKKAKQKLGVAKWFSPTVFLFLCCACPPIWIFEIHLFNLANTNSTPSLMKAAPQTGEVQPPFHYGPPKSRQSIQSLRGYEVTSEATNQLEDSFEKREPSETIDAELYDFDNVSSASQSRLNDEKVDNETLTLLETTSTDSNDEVNEATDLPPEELATFTETATDFEQTNFPSLIAPTKPAMIQLNLTEENDNAFEQIFKTISSVPADHRVRILEQILLLALIFGRWLLPRGGITRDQLSQLLLVNIGMAADILELFEAFKEPIVRQNGVLTLIILTLWQASLLQFSLTKTATKARKIRSGFTATHVHKNKHNCIFCETELWAICTSLMLQDVPFFTLRMTLIFRYSVISYSNYFFTSKNTLVILLQLFRSGVIVSEHIKADTKPEDPSSAGFELVQDSFASPPLTPAAVNKNSIIQPPSPSPSPSEQPRYRFRGGYWVGQPSYCVDKNSYISTPREGVRKKVHLVLPQDSVESGVETPPNIRVVDRDDKYDDNDTNNKAPIMPLMDDML